MKSRLYLLAPNGNDFSDAQVAAIKKHYDEFVYVDKAMDWSDLPGINDDCEKVFAVDPDFCDWDIPNHALDTAGLRAVCLDTTSYSWVDLEYAKSRNIAVTNVKYYSTDSVAETGILMAMSVAKKLPLLAQNNMEMDHEAMRGVELRGKTAGIIGLGHIGSRLAELCLAMGMKVVYWSQKSGDGRFEKVQLADIFTRADVIFPALLKNEETSALITDAMLSSMKPGAMFIDVSGNMLHNHELLLEMAVGGRIYGYGFEESPVKTYAGNVLALPFIAYYTDEAMARNTAQWLECILSVKNGDVKNKLN